MELKCINLQKELITPWKIVEVAKSLQEAMKVCGSLSTLAARMIEQEGHLRDSEKWYKVVFYSIKDKARQVDEQRKYVEVVKAL